MPQSIIDLLMSAGLAGVAFLAFAEKYVPIIPSYVMLAAFGALGDEMEGGLAATVAAATLGSVAGALGWYWLGRLLSGRAERFVARRGRYILLTPKLYDRMRGAYGRHPFLVTLVAQTIPTVRIFIGLPAGVMRMPFRPYLAATVLGTLIWNAPLVMLGDVLAESRMDTAHVMMWFAAAILGVEVTAFIVWRLMRRGGGGHGPGTVG